MISLQTNCIPQCGAGSIWNNPNSFFYLNVKTNKKGLSVAANMYFFQKGYFYLFAPDRYYIDSKSSFNAAGNHDIPRNTMDFHRHYQHDHVDYISRWFPLAALCYIAALHTSSLNRRRRERKSSFSAPASTSPSQPSSRIHCHCHPHHRAEKDKFKSNPATPLMISYHQHLRIINFQIY